jgi:hypothetical protein
MSVLLIVPALLFAACIVIEIAAWIVSDKSGGFKKVKVKA